MYGKLVAIGDGSIIPLPKSRQVVGRRDDCDVVLKFSNVSGHHCELYLEGGYWYAKDLNSSNGTKLNGNRISQSYLPPNSLISFAHNNYKIEYSPEANGATTPPPEDEATENTVRSIFGKSLLERAGLSKKTVARVKNSEPEAMRYDPRNNEAGQLRRKRED